MKKHYLILAILFAFTTASFAQKCKPAVSTVDKFTEQKLEGWGGKLGSSRNMFQGVSQNLKLHIGTLEGKMFVEISVQYMQKGYDASVNEIDIPKGSLFKIKTEKGILTFTANKSQRAKRKRSGYLTTVINLTADLTEEQLNDLSSSLITMYRIEPEESEAIKGTVKSRRAKKLMKQFNCYKKTIGDL